jgi:DivIVA domain-containing protein
MIATEPEILDRVRPDGVRRRRFAKVRKGYDPDQVRDYLDRVASELQRLEEELHLARSEADSIARGVRAAREDAYSDLAIRMADLLRTADLHAQEIRREAADEAKAVVSEAQLEVDRIRREARVQADRMRAEAEEVLRRAREESEGMLASLASRRDAILADLQAMRGRLVGVVEHLEEAMAGEEEMDEGEEKPAPADALWAPEASAELAARPPDPISMPAAPRPPDPPDDMPSEVTAMVELGGGMPSADTIDLFLPEMPLLEDDLEVDLEEPPPPPPPSQED